MRSSREQVCRSSGHSRRCSIVWSASLQSHVVSSSYVYFHFLRLCMQRPIFVRSLFRHLHSVHVSDAPLAKHSLGVCGSLWGTDCRCWNHCSNLRVDELWISSSAACMKLFLDLSRFLGRLWPCNGCLLSFTCFSRSRWAVTLLLTSGGAIPARRCKFSTLVGCMHPVMARQANIYIYTHYVLVEIIYICWGLSSACEFQSNPRKLTRVKLLMKDQWINLVPGRTTQWGMLDWRMWTIIL